MQRHPSLQPLSRDHREILERARELRLAAEQGESRERAAQVFLRQWKDWIADHLELEQTHLTEHVTTADARRLRAEHEGLRALAESLRRTAGVPPRVLIERLGDRLHAYVRWEERDLFPRLEASISEEALARLGKVLREVEASRPRSKGACES